MRKLLAASLALLFILSSLLFAQAETEIPGLTYESSMELIYADQFSVDYYEGGYALISVVDGDRLLAVPEGAEVPEGLDPSIMAVHTPVKNMYLAATASMALLDALDALDSVRLSSVAAEGWYVENAAAAMKRGEILFGGKYSEPDYELMIQENCELALESTMIYHTPKVKEMIEMLGIPVFVEKSSYESHPLGRSEWIRLFGVLCGKEAEAEAYFAQQADTVQKLADEESAGKTVAFFYISSDGSVVVRSSTDYVPGMIELAGGRYVPENVANEESRRSTVPVTMEQFYAAAIDADYLVYNASIDAPISSIDELLSKSSLFADFKAVKEGNVWSTGKYMYQATDNVGDQIADLHAMLTGAEGELNFIYKLN